ncbi:multicopper oxidase domain-containing protein [bacterium]|nr:multicopper oxidase domain-containing protein [candidate division CSSED10-310 bacterium]
MRSLRFNTLIYTGIIAALLATSPSPAMDVNLRAEQFVKTMPDGVPVTMWGFAVDSAFGTEDGDPQSPGPVIRIPHGDTTLTVYLDNNLDEAMSLVIPGLSAVMTPVRNGDGRVRSFTHETPSMNTIAGVYTWSDLRPGSYIYQSGTHPAVHIQMGLYGPMVQDETAGQAYGITESVYDSEVILFLSEIDMDLHTAIATGNYGPGQAMTSTINYHPRYYLINGMSYGPGTTPIPAGLPGNAILLRFFNASLKSHAPLLHNTDLTIIAQDGRLMPYMRPGNSVYLPASKTADAMIYPASAGYIPVYDRMMSVTNDGEFPGGMLAYLDIKDLDRRELTVNFTGSGTGTVIIASAPGGLECQDDCVTEFNAGTGIRLKAIPDPGSSFLRWGSGSSEIGGDLEVLMDRDRTVNAIFSAADSIHSVPQQVSGSGSTHPDKAAEQLGIQIEAIRRSADDHLLDVRFRVLDTEKASAMFDFRNEIALIHEKTGTRLMIPNTPKAGKLRPTRRGTAEGKTYFILFRNSGRLVRSGEAVTLIVGNTRIRHLNVQ